MAVDGVDLTVFRETDKEYTEVRLRITDRALVGVNLDSFERALLVDCEKPGRSIADFLLALQTLVFRMEQQASGSPDETGSHD
jgi:hypothetical protein